MLFKLDNRNHITEKGMSNTHLQMISVFWLEITIFMDTISEYRFNLQSIFYIYCMISGMLDSGNSH